MHSPICLPLYRLSFILCLPGFTMGQIQESISSSYSTFESATVMIILATIAVILRFVSKTFTKARFSCDDYWIFLSLVALWTHLGLICWALFIAGGGLDMPNLRDLDLVKTSLYVEVRDRFSFSWETIIWDR